MTITIWRITDGKAGHDSQSTGLCNAIERLKPCARFDLPATPLLDNLIDFVSMRTGKAGKLPDPDIIIGAGHATHLTMLTGKRVRNGKTVVLMRPSLPLTFFDCCIIPKHDAPPLKENVIVTTGALNPMLYNENKSRNSGLILLGGPSKHYIWDSQAVVNQLTAIIRENRDIRWAIADSPRTPGETSNMIKRLLNANIEFLSFKETGTDTLHKLIFDAGRIWISADSISMVFEALTSGAKVGLIEVKKRKKTRLSNAINALIGDNNITPFSRWQITGKLGDNTLKINEAERCSRLLLAHGFLD